MISCRDCKDRMVEAVYGELGVADRRAFDEHIVACLDCAADFAGLDQTRRAMNTRKPSPPSEDILESAWPDFLSRLRASEAGRAWSHRGTVRRWVMNLAAASALIVIGVLIGRHGQLNPWPQSVKLEPNEAPAAAGPTLDDRVGRYLEKSKLVLMSVDNMNTAAYEEAAFDLSPERKLSKDLLRESRILRRELRASREDQMIDLISQLEVTLLQIANLRDPQVPIRVELARTGIEERALLFKINLEEMRRASERLSKSKRERESSKRRIG
jgi:hypothetical protein